MSRLCGQREDGSGWERMGEDGRMRTGGGGLTAMNITRCLCIEALRGLALCVGEVAVLVVEGGGKLRYV